MKKRISPVFEFTILVLVAAVLAVAAIAEETWPMGVRLVLMLAAIALLALAMAIGLAWVQYNLALVEEQRAKVAAVASLPMTTIIDRLMQMTPEQLSAFQQLHIVPTVEVLAGLPGPVHMLRVGDGATVPLDFLADFINAGSQTEFQSVRNLAPAERAYAMQFLQYASSMGWAEMPAGNQPAKWVDRNSAIRAIWGG